VRDLSGREIRWVSPLKDDEFAEYRDAAFLEKLNLQDLSDELHKFWPKNGPQWDALARTTDGEAIILVEAKANVPELVSFCGAKDRDSVCIISESLAKTQEWLTCRDPRIDWKYGFYQYANRLAHLYFLREKGGKEVYLIFLYFIGDDTHISTSQEAWKCAIEPQRRLMGLSASSLRGKAVDIFITTNEKNAIIGA